jgi:hypothetical protein
MTYHVSNPCCNPKKGYGKRRIETKKLQKYYDAKIKKSRENTKKIDEKPKREFTSSFNSFMTEFTAMKDKMPKDYDSWHRSRPTWDIIKVDEFGDEKVIETTWSEPQKLPRVPQFAGIHKIVSKEKAELVTKVQRQSENKTYAETFFDKDTETSSEEKHIVELANIL